MKKRLYEILEKGEKGDIPSRLFHLFIVSTILLSIASVILETVPSLENRFHNIFSAFERLTIIFTIEYILRVYSCTCNPKYASIITGRIRFALTPMAIIDLIAFLPFYLPFAAALDLRFIRVFRLFRIFRIFKLGRYSESFKMVASVIKEKKEELAIAVFFMLVLLLLSSTLLYHCESTAQPDKYDSIPSAMWWAVTALTTVGYGDIYPITPLGKIIASLTAIIGIGLFAIPAGILASGFSEKIHKKPTTICPHCGSEI